MKFFKYRPLSISISGKASYKNTHNLLSFTSRRSHSVCLNIAKPTSKSFQEIPRERGMNGTLLGLMADGGAKNLHKRVQRLHEKLGPIYVDKLGTTSLVYISDVNLIRKVQKNEGKYPRQNIPEAWTLFNKVHKVNRGLFFQQGEDWLRLRKPMSKILLADRFLVESFANSVFNITHDIFVDELQSSNKRTIEIDDVKALLCKWSIEATSVMLFGERLAHLTKHDSAKQSQQVVDELINLVQLMFKQTSKFQMIPAYLAQKFNLKIWKEFKATSIKMLQVSSELCDAGLNYCKANSVNSIAYKFLTIKNADGSECMSEQDVSRSIIDLIIAASDTTSNSLQWSLHCLGKYQHAQEKLYQQLMQTNYQSSINANINYRKLSECEYLQAFIKETNRLYPTAPFIARTLDSQIELNGYIIPENTTIVYSLFTTSRDDKYFHAAQEFMPERWLKTHDKSTANQSTTDTVCPYKQLTTPLASLPFGIGSRMCIGKRLAELQMTILMSTLVKNYHLTIPENQTNGNLGLKLDMILTPTQDIRISLERRQR